MNAHNLNQSGKKIPDKPYDRGDKVYFYQPPPQNEVIQRERKAKHLMPYRGLSPNLYQVEEDRTK